MFTFIKKKQNKQTWKFPEFHLTAKYFKYAEYITIPEDWPFSEEFQILHTLAPIMQNSLEKSEM